MLPRRNPQRTSTFHNTPAIMTPFYEGLLGAIFLILSKMSGVVELLTFFPQSRPQMIRNNLLNRSGKLK